MAWRAWLRASATHFIPDGQQITRQACWGLRHSLCRAYADGEFGTTRRAIPVFVLVMYNYVMVYYANLVILHRERRLQRDDL